MNSIGTIVVVSVMIGAAVALAAQNPPKAEPQMQAVLDQLAKLGPKPIETLSPAEARKQPTPADAVMALLKSQGKSTAPEAVGKVEDKTFPGPAGPVAIRIYTPAGTGPFPVVLYIHGGGWVIANLDTYDASARALTNAAQAVLVSTHYRQAPEHKFPAAHDDTWAAYEWVMKNASLSMVTRCGSRWPARAPAATWQRRSSSPRATARCRCRSINC